MASNRDPTSPDLRSPDELARVDDAERLRLYAEDWVSMPRRGDSGSRLGPEAQRQVLSLFALGYDEAAIRRAAQQALAATEARIAQRYRLIGWAVFIASLAFALIAVLSWQGRGEAQHAITVALLGAVGLMLAHGVHMQGVRRRTRLLRSVEARREAWRQAVASLVAAEAIHARQSSAGKPVD